MHYFNEIYGLDGAYLPKNSESRSISAENITGEKGRGGMATVGSNEKAASELGQTWKVSPSVIIPEKSVYTIADFKGRGVINHMWFADCRCFDRALIIRIYWDGSDIPSVEVPLTDFFACAKTAPFAQVNSVPVCYNPLKGMNCFWKMPFYSGFRITIENTENEFIPLFYQIDFELKALPEQCRYFHAHYRQECPVGESSIYTVLDNIYGAGTYIGTYMLFKTHRPGWWGEGELKFFIDGDKDFPTICGTGTEDYFLGTHCYDVGGRYAEYSTPFAGLAHVIDKDPLDDKKAYLEGQSFSMYRWHLPDPICFKEDLKITAQDLGWKGGGLYRLRHDDISTVSYFYLDRISESRPVLPSYEELKTMLS